jgi:hypothetical protein
MNCDDEYYYNYYDDIFIHGLESVAVGMSLCCGFFRTGEYAYFSLLFYFLIGDLSWGKCCLWDDILFAWPNCSISN